MAIEQHHTFARGFGLSALLKGHGVGLQQEAGQRVCILVVASAAHLSALHGLGVQLV